jgi:hypothetical protein
MTNLSPVDAMTAATQLAARPLLEKVARMADCIDQRTIGEIMAISDQAAAWLEANPPGQPVAIEPRGCPTPQPEPPSPISAHDLAIQWNQQADQSEQWDSLELDEQLAFAQSRAIAADRARRPVAQPEPEGGWLLEGLTLDEELQQMLFDNHRGAIEFLCDAEEEAHLMIRNHVKFALAALARWGRPTPQPVAVSERPWEKETGWLDLDGECWWCPPDGTPYWSLANPAMVYGGWVLPANALPLPEAQP